MRLIIGILAVTSMLSAQTVVGPRVPATGTYANRPTSPATNTVYIVTDDASAGACTGGGSARSQCQWSGSAWVALGGTGGGGSGSITCDSGTVPYTSLTAASTSQEVTILSSVAGLTGYEYSLLSETTQFTGGAATALTVSMGRTGTNNAEMSGGTFTLKQSSGDANFVAFIPPIPQMTSTYNIVLNFTATGANVNTFTAGVLSYRVCHNAM